MVLYPRLWRYRLSGAIGIFSTGSGKRDCTSCQNHDLRQSAAADYCNSLTNPDRCGISLAGTFICFYLLFQPKMATIADVASSILGLLYGGYLPSYWVRLRVGLTQASSLPSDAVASASNLPLKDTGLPLGLT
jgi:hypothetical protein